MGPFFEKGVHYGTTIITQKENKGEYNGLHCWDDSCSTKPEWIWNDNDIYARVFDQNGFVGSNGTPYRYPAAKASPDDASWIFNLPSNAVCTQDNSTTSGNTLYSGTRITSQKSCNPNTLNAGNWYNFPAASAGFDATTLLPPMPSYITTEEEFIEYLYTHSEDYTTPNSICPKGWRLPPVIDNKSYDTLIHTAYGITTTSSDSQILASPLSFVRLGFLGSEYGTVSDRGLTGTYTVSFAYNAYIEGYGEFYENSWFRHSQDTLETLDSWDRANGFSVRCVSR